MTQTLSEEALASRLVSADSSILEYLYDNYSAALYGVIVRICQDRTVAEDILQDSFTKIWLNRGRYDASQATVFTWMLTIARRSAIDYIRSRDFKERQMNQSLEDFVDTDVLGSTQAVPLEATELPKLLISLPSEQKQVIDLMYFKGYTQSEIAEKLNTPIGTVKSRLRLGLNALRKIFHDE